MDENTKGQIITFYSYKGGTGRTMTLANVACILAEQQTNTNGKGVLLIDWDLEAPGLHRYFNKWMPSRRRLEYGRSEDVSDGEPGLIDLFYEIDRRIDESQAGSMSTESIQPVSGMSSEEAAREVLHAIDIDKYILSLKINGLSLMKAGRFNPQDTNEYPHRVNTFNWEALYQKSPQLMRVFAEVLAERYGYVLIDSRTGVTDISGVCTMLLPEKLVLVFTPNMQSLSGAVDVARRVTDYRKESDDLRPLIIYPLVSRVEANEPKLRKDWRFGNSEKNIIGYQAEFENVLAEAYDKDEVILDKYFNVMQIQHIPHYAYGEEIAVLEEEIEDKFSLKQGYKTFVSTLMAHHLPWEGQHGVDASLEQGLSPFVTNVYQRIYDGFKTFAPAIAALSLVFAGFAFYTYSTTRSQLTSVQSENASLLETKGALESQLAEYKNAGDVIKTKNDTIEQLFAQLNQASAASNEQLETLNKQLTASQKTANDAQQRARAAASNAQQAQQQSDTLQKQVSSLQNELARCRPKAEQYSSPTRRLGKKGD